ncbi:P-loop containing nucleoside triphosphate hydrolase protein, partial [Flagelloscypha sp. PMI_526]
MSEDTNGFTILSIDGASMHQSGAIPPLLILQEIASRYEGDKKSAPGSFRARKTFHMIGGVGDGGLLALMLGHFGMSVNDAIREYRHILKAIHQHPDSAGWSKDERSRRFEAALKAFVVSKTSPNDENCPLIKPKEENPRCKVFVTAMHALNLQHPILLRTYRSRIDADPPICTVVEAIRATTAMPELFMPVTLGPPHRKINYVSPSCHGFNNPIDQVRQEAKEALSGRSISCIISLGCGHPGPIQINDVKEDAARAVVQLAMDSVRAAEQTYRRLAGIPNLYFRFDVPYGLERAVLKLNPTLSEIRAHITSYVRQEQTSDRLNSAVKQLVEKSPSVEASELDGLLPVENTATVWVKKCPLPSPNFTGRRDELDHMHTYFSSGAGSSSHLYVIYGLGGSGKTQLLLQFVLECQTRSPRMQVVSEKSSDVVANVFNRFDVVYFADASLQTTLEADLKAIAIDRKVGETAADAVQWLSYQTNRWLLVLDNADDKTFSIQKYIPKSIHGNIIITSRNPELTGLTSRDSGSRRIEGMEKWAAEELLKKLVGPGGRHSDGEDSLVTQVVEKLHCFALAITQAGSYMSATACGYQEYIELFEVERSRLLRERKGHVPDNYPWSVYTTWAISFDQLPTAPRHFMQICSYLHYTGIPKDLFKRAVESEPLTDVDEGAQNWLSEFMYHTRSDRGRWDPVAFDGIIQNVISFSLLDYDPESRLFSFHPLVHDWTRESIQFAYSQDFPDVQCALQLVALSTPRIGDNSSTSAIVKRRLLPHLDSLVSGAIHISS